MSNRPSYIADCSTEQLIQLATELRVICKANQWDDLRRHLDALIEMETKDLLIAGLEMINTAVLCRQTARLNQQDDHFDAHDKKMAELLSPDFSALAQYVEFPDPHATPHQPTHSMPSPLAAHPPSQAPSSSDSLAQNCEPTPSLQLLRKEMGQRHDIYRRILRTMQPLQQPDPPASSSTSSASAPSDPSDHSVPCPNPSKPMESVNLTDH